MSIPKAFEIMGVLNANDDSFYAQSRFSEKNTLSKIEEMIQDGADIIILTPYLQGQVQNL